MIDGCGRQIDHLRLSITDHCNLACRYCVPSKPSVDAAQMIDVEFGVQAVEWLARDHGIRHVRVTGGEPLLHPQVGSLVRRIAALPELVEVTLTTNGQALSQRARLLRDAGLARVNISLDTLAPDRFRHVTRGGDLGRTLAGIDAAIEAGLTPVKLNVVVQRGLNDDEVVSIAEWGLSRTCVVRFLEVMPIGPSSHVLDQHLVPAGEILARLANRFHMHEIHHSPGQPAVDYAVNGADVRGVVGVIAPTTRPFCERCRRIRLTSRGALVPCVHDRNRASLLDAWDGIRLHREHADAILAKVIAAKAPAGPMNQNVPLITIGG
ncbi:Cyclic pyranopterin monophosphate synthase [Phycisphaerae bacterium RAS1]|nr:Cyclic pyranopterin monophosphate synthase [Phycisphaerae bacterium RAS1]